MGQKTTQILRNKVLSKHWWLSQQRGKLQVLKTSMGKKHGRDSETKGDYKKLLRFPALLSVCVT